MANRTNKQIYEDVFRKLKENMDQVGEDQWILPWHAIKAGRPLSMGSGKPYSGANVLILSFIRHCKGYKSRTWATFNQVQKLGGRIIKGSKAAPILYYKTVKIRGVDDAGDPTERNIPMARSYSVFNMDQVSGLDDPFPLEQARGPGFDPIAEAEAIVAGYKNGPVIQTGSTRACYNPKDDVIQMPDRETFKSAEGYYSTIFHEFIHTTGHTKRLNRDSLAKISGFADHSYSEEELVAEIGSAMLQGAIGILNDAQETQSAAYVKHWWAKIGSDPAMLCRAASQAQRGVGYIYEQTDLIL